MTVDPAVSRLAKKFIFVGGIGTTYLTYRETGVKNYTMVALTPKASLSYRHNDLWEFGVSSFATAMPLSRTDSGITARFLGVNARVGYVLPFVKPPWRVSLMTGGYYTRMFVTANRFGFNNMYGPQLFPSITKMLGFGKFLHLYGKVSPVSDGNSSFGFTNRELATGFGYTKVYGNAKSVSFTVDAAQFHLSVKRIEITANSITLGASYGY